MDGEGEGEGEGGGEEGEGEDGEEGDGEGEGEEAPQCPECQDLRISTSTKVLFLNFDRIDIVTLFWDIPVIKYTSAEEGVVKKQMKLISTTQEEFQVLRQKLAKLDNYYDETVIKHVDNPDARTVKFNDERKVTIGISKKDILSYRGKKKNAFYNCFALTIRVLYLQVFREFHVKVFNTGKIEIPGVVNSSLLLHIKTKIVLFLDPFIAKTGDTPETMAFKDVDKEQNVLINSDFNCGFCINREKLYTILRSVKYQIETAFDPCSYPGVKCKFYYNHLLGMDDEKQTGQILREDAMKMNQKLKNPKYTEVSFMIFRTGSSLIVGNCSEQILRFVFEFIKTILRTEFMNIRIDYQHIPKAKKAKIRKRKIFVSEEYFHTHVLVDG